MEMTDDSRPTVVDSVHEESVDEMATEPQLNERDEEKDESSSFFPIGTVVDVMPRLWPGINKPGGVGRVYGVHYDEEEDCYLYDVQYIVVSGKEERIEERFVKLHVEETGHRSVRGRCKLCGSFIRDCQHTAADIAEHYRKLREVAEEKRLGLKKKKDTTKSNVDEKEESKGSSSSSKVASGSVPHKRSKLNESNAADNQMSDSSSESDPSSSSSEYNEDSGSSNDEDLIQETTAVKQQSASASLASDELSALTNEVAKERARSLHRQLYNTCLQGDATEDNVFINNSRNDDTNYLSVEYREAVQSLKTLTLGECMELLRLCHNFIINMRLRAVSPTTTRSATLEYQRHQLSMDLSAVTSDLRQQQDEDHKLELAERVVTLDEKQEKLFRQIERAGFDIFNKAEKRARSLLKVSVFKKPLKRQIMTLSLAVSDISSSWAEEMKKARVEMIDIADTFADIFGRYAEDVIDGIEASDGETSEDPDDANNDDNDHHNKNDSATVKPSARDRLRDPVQEAGIKRPRPQSDADSDDEDFEFPRRPTQVSKKMRQRQRQRKLSASAARWQQRRARLGYGRSLSDDDDDDEQSDDEQVDSNTIDLTGNDDASRDGRPSSRTKAANATKRVSAAAVAKKKSVKIFRRKDGQSSSLSSSTTKPTAIPWTFDSRISDSALVQTNVELTRRRKRPHRYASFQPSNRSSARTASNISKRSASSSSFSSNRIDDTDMDVDDLTTGNSWEASAIIAWDSDDEQGTVADLSNQLRAYKQRQRRNQQQQQQRQHSNRLPSGRSSNGSGNNNRSSTDDRIAQDDDYVNLLHQPTSTAKDGKGSKKPSIRKTCYFRTSIDTVDPTISYDGRIIVLENDQYVGNVVNLNVPVPHRSIVSERIADRLLSCYDTPITRLDYDRDAVSDFDEDDNGGGDEETGEATTGFNGHRGGSSVSISSYIQQYLARYDSSGRDTAAALMSTTAATGVEGDGDDVSSPMDKQHTYINFLYDCFMQATTAASQRSSSSSSSSSVGQDDVRGLFRKIVVRNVVWQLHSCVAQATVFRLEEERLQWQLDQVTSATQRSSLMTSVVPVFAAQVHEWERQLHSLVSFIPAITFSDLQPMFLKTRAASTSTAAAESFFYSEPIHWLHLFLSTSEIEQEISHALLPLLPTHQLAHERTATFPSTIRWIDTLLSIVELNETALTSSWPTSSSSPSLSSPSSPWSMDKYAQALYRLACQLLVALLQWKLTLIQKLVALLLASPSYQAAPSSSNGTSSSATATAHTPGHEPVDKQLAQAIKQSFIDLFQVVVFLVYRLLRSPALSLHLLPLMSQRDLSSSSSSSTSSSSIPTAASPVAAHEHVIVNFPLELLLSALHHFGHAQTSLATLKLPAENELTKMITCRWWEIVQTIVLAGDSAWTMTNSQLPSLFWQRLLWQRLSLQGGFQTIPRGNLPSPVSSLALAPQNLPTAWTLWTNPECLWAMLAVLTKYQRLRLQQSRCTNHWTLVHCLCKWNMRVLASSADTHVAPKPLLLKGLLRNIHRLAAIALYWDAGNEALLIFLDLVPQMAALLNQLDTLHVTTTTTAAATDDETLPPKSTSNSRAEATGKKTSGYSSSSGGVLASLLQQQQQHQQYQQYSSTSDAAGDRHFRWMQLTPRVSLLLADHWQRELAQKRRQGGPSSSSASREHGHPQSSVSSSFTWQQARNSLHRYLLQLVTLTFVSYRMPHPLGPLCDALLVAQSSHRRKDHTESTAAAAGTTATACDWSVFLHDNDANGGGTSSSNASHAAANTNTTTLSLWTIESLRMSLKLLLRNITTTVDVATGHHSLSAPLLQRIANFFAPAATVDRWVSIFMAHPHFMSGNLLCLLTKELESGLSMTHVRTRMGLSTKLIDAFIATPLQPMSGADYTTVASDLSFTAEDRQRSCLMFFASLLVFNPFPIPTTRVSSTAKPSSSSSTTTTTMEWMVNMSREDTMSLAPFLNLVQLVQTMCMHSVLDHGRVTEEVEVLLLASMNISNVVIHHLDLCYVPAHWSTIAVETTTATTTTTSTTMPPNAASSKESLLRSFPDTIFHVSLQLFNTMMQMTTATDTIKIRSKRNVMELSAFAVLFVTSWMRGVHHYVEYLHQEDPTMPGVAAMAASELNKIASLYSTVILQQVQSKVKTLVMSLLRKCRETLETFSVVPSDVTATSGAHKRRHHQHPSSTTTTTSPSMDTFLYPERLDQLQENASYVFAVSTAKIMVPAVELLGHAVHLGWSLTHAGVLPSSAASSIADSLWQSWYESIDLSLLAGTDMCVGFWMKALLWRQMAQQVASLQQQLTQQCPSHLATVMATDPRYHYARVRQQQMHYTLMSYRRIFVQHLHDILLCLLALEAMPAVKMTMVLEINVEMLTKTIVEALQTLNLLTVEPAMPPLTPQWSLHPQCFSRQVPAGATAVTTLGPIHVLVLSTLARYRSAVEALVSTPLALLHECIQQLLKMKATAVTATATTVGAAAAAAAAAGQGMTTSSALPSNFVDHLVQHVYLRVLRFLNLCRFQASEGSMRDIDKAVVAVHQPLTQLITFAENRCFPGDVRVTLVTISLYFSDFVHPFVKHGLTLLRATHLPAQRLGATTTTTAKAARTSEALDTLPHWQRLLTAELPLLLPSWILLAMSVPFATRCKEWSVLLEVLMVVYHPRMKGLTPYRATIREAFLVEIQALLLNEPSAMLPNDVRTAAVAGNYVSKLYSFGVPVDLTALLVAARQFVGFVFDVQCPLWFRTILSLERSLYENDYDLLRLSEPQVQEVIGQIVQDVRQALSSVAT